MSSYAPGAAMRLETYAWGVSKVGTVTVELLALSDRSTPIPPQTAGIAFDAVTKAHYINSLVAPTTQGDYDAIWDDHAGTTAVERITVTYSIAVPGVPPSNAERYLNMTELKTSLTMLGQGYSDADMLRCLDAASRALEQEYRNYWTIGVPGEVRYYTAMTDRLVPLGDLLTPTLVAVDIAYGTEWGPGTYGRTLQTTDYRLLPIQNGPSGGGGNGQAYKTLQLARPAVPPYLPLGTDAIKITGTYGFEVPPSGVKSSVGIIATRLLRRIREAPFGVFAVGADGLVARAGDLARDTEIKAAMLPVSGPLIY